MTRWSRYYPHGIIAGALMLGCAVYLSARPASVFYIGGQMTGPLLGQLPSFLHTLAFALASSLTISRNDRVIAAILVWGAIETLAECAQHERFPVPEALAAYQQASTYDVLDLAAILAALVLAIFVCRKTRCR